jgi:hypothetical protein
MGFRNKFYCCVPEVFSKTILSSDEYCPPVIRAQAGIQASLNWSPAPICTGAGAARE